MDLRATALSLIKTHGAAITATRTTSTGYDVDNGEVTGVFKEYSSYAVNSEFLRAGNTEAYVKDSLTLLIAPTSYVPEEGDVITWNSKSYIVKTVNKVSPAGLDQVYEVGLEQ